MRIHFEKKLISLANPRCGSTSIRDALTPFGGEGAGDGLNGHACLRSVEKFIRDTRGEPIDGYTVVTTIRNPWERTVSIFHYGLSNPKSIWHKPAVEAGSVASFCKDKVLDWVFRPIPEEGSHPEGPFDIISFGSDAKGAFRAEVYDITQMPALESRLRGLGLPVSIPHINQSAHEDYRAYFDDVSRERVRRLFAKDIEIMGYTFDGGGAAGYNWPATLKATALA
jgi:hypothetical protein